MNVEIHPENVPAYLQNTPRSLVTFPLERAQRVSNLKFDSVREQTDGSFEICSDDPGVNDIKLNTMFFFGKNKTFCICSCRDFKRTKFLCKHFFAIIESVKKQFSDLTRLFLGHPFMDSFFLKIMNLIIFPTQPL